MLLSSGKLQAITVETLFKLGWLLDEKLLSMSCAQVLKFKRVLHPCLVKGGAQALAVPGTVLHPILRAHRSLRPLTLYISALQFAFIVLRVGSLILQQPFCTL